MMIDAVKDNVNPECIRKRGLKKEGCSILLDNIPQQRLIIDLDILSCPSIENQTRCDFLFMAEPPGELGWIVPIELKKGQPKTSEVERQLQTGANVAEALVPKDVDVKFCPVVASGEDVSKGQRRTLKDIMIRFHDQTEPVRRIRCKSSLHTVLK